MSCNLLAVCGEHFIHEGEGGEDMQPAGGHRPSHELEQGTRADYNSGGADKILIQIQIQKLRLLRVNHTVYRIG